MLTLEALVQLSDRRVSAVLAKYRIGALRNTVDTGWTKYDAIIYGGHNPARCSIMVKEQKVDSQCEVECSCEYFAMNLQVVLATYGVTRTVTTDKLPMKRNPAMKPGLCPHLYLLALHLGKEWTAPEATEEASENVNKVTDKPLPT